MENNPDEIPSPSVETKKDNGNKSEKLKSKIEDTETLKAQIDVEINELDSLMENLEIAFDVVASENNLSGKEKTKQRKKALGFFETAIKKLKKRKDSDAKLDKIKEIQEDIIKKINGDMLGENEESMGADAENIKDKKSETNSFNKNLAKGLDEEFNTVDANGVDRYYSRKGAKMLVDEIDEYEKLNASTNKEREKKFKTEFRKILENLAVHGSLYRDEKTKEIEIEKKGDLDVKTALGLLQLAGVNIKNVEYVAPGKSVPGKKNIDTGNKDGFVIMDDGTVYIDHHAEFSGNYASATQYTYDILKSLEMIKKEDCEYLDNLIEFINQVDNFTGPSEYYKNYFFESWETLAGLSKMLSFKELQEFFKFQYERAVSYEKTDDQVADSEEIKNQVFPWKPLPETLLKKFGFLVVKKNKEGRILETKGKSVSHKERVLESQKELIKMEKEGFIIDSERYGRICLSINRRVSCGTDAAKAFGCNTFLAWNTNDNDFFISSLNGGEIEDDFTDGLSVRKTMWVNPKDKERHVTLAEILNKMTDGKFEPSEAVKSILEEKKIVEEDEKNEDEIVEDLENTGEVLTDLSHEEIGHPADADLEEKIPVVEDFEFDEDKAENLTEIERRVFEELLAEKKTEIETQLEKIEFEFGDFLESHLKETEFNHLIQKEIIVLGENLKNLKKITEDDYKTHVEHEKILKLIHESDDIIKISSKDAWERRLEKFKVNLEREEFEFSEAQEEKIKIVTELFEKKKFIESLEGANWSGYREDDKKVATELIVKAQLRLVLAKMKKDFDNENVIDKAADKIFDNLKSDKK